MLFESCHTAKLEGPKGDAGNGSSMGGKRQWKGDPLFLRPVATFGCCHQRRYEGKCASCRGRKETRRCIENKPAAVMSDIAQTRVSVRNNRGKLERNRGGMFQVRRKVPRQGRAVRAQLHSLQQRKQSATRRCCHAARVLLTSWTRSGRGVTRSGS